MRRVERMEMQLQGASQRAEDADSSLEAEAEAEALVRVDRVSKRFGGVRALDGVTMGIAPGEHVGLVGDNGAGKSTLVKILSGVFPADEGCVYLNGREVRFHSPMEARRAGIETVYQDLALADDLDVSANIFLGREERIPGWLGPAGLLRHREMRTRAQQLLSSTGVKIPKLTSRLRQLSGGQRQGVAIARAVSWGTRFIIMDEPTAALGVQESSKVEAIIRNLKQSGLAALIVSHNLRQVMDLVDVIWVLRGGRMVGSRPVGDATLEEIVAMIVGKHDDAAAIA